MLPNEIRSKVDKVRNDFWTGGVSNPLTAIEQTTNLLYAKELDEVQTREEAKANTLGRPLERRIFPEGKDGLETPGFPDGGCPYELLRWS